MKTTIGLWIDHRKAVIVAVSDKGEETKVIESMVEKQPGRFAGIRSTTSFEAQKVQADDSRERKFSGQLHTYYDEVVSAVRDAESILLFGPGEAKGELKKRFEKGNYSAAPHLLRHRPAHVRTSTLRRPLSRIWGTDEQLQCIGFYTFPVLT